MARVIGAVLACWVVLLVVAAGAAAQALPVEPFEAPANRAEVIEIAKYRNAPTPGVYDWAAENALPDEGNTPKSQIREGLNRARLKAGVFGSLRVLGAAGLAIAAGETGWKIGRAIDTKVLRISDPLLSQSLNTNMGRPGRWRFTGMGTEKSSNAGLNVGILSGDPLGGTVCCGYDTSTWSSSWVPNPMASQVTIKFPTVNEDADDGAARWVFSWIPGSTQDERALVPSYARDVLMCSQITNCAEGASQLLSSLLTARLWQRNFETQQGIGQPNGKATLLPTDSRGLNYSTNKQTWNTTGWVSPVKGWYTRTTDQMNRNTRIRVRAPQSPADDSLPTYTSPLPPDSAIYDDFIGALREPESKLGREWINSQLDKDYTAPTRMRIPDCRGSSFGTCRDLLYERGLETTPQRVIRSVETADYNYAPGAVVKTTPTRQTEIDRGAVVTIETNPIELPAIVPDWVPNSDPTIIEEAIRNAGLIPVRRIEPERNPDIQDGRVTRLNPDRGTKLDRGDLVEVWVNPGTPLPPPVEGPYDPPGDLPDAPTLPSIDFSPLKVGSGDRFPFGVPGWVSGSLGGFGGGANCPEWSHDFEFKNRPGLSDQTKRLEVSGCGVGEASFDNVRDVYRPVMVVCSFIALAWVFMAAAMGFGSAATND